MLVMLAPAAWSQGGGAYTIVGASIGGGGARASAGGNYALGGLIRPPGGSPLTGGGYSLHAGAWPGPGGPVTDAGPPDAAPGRTVLLGARPNPFMHGARIHFELVSTSNVRMDIVDVAGHRFRRLGGPFDAGRHQLFWDGRDDDGVTVSPGVYFVQFEAAGFRSSQRFVKLD
jgi:hypothetical protein